ncbi:anti-sigma factor family protein [Streptomyces sp. NPDC051567]|uniref:anti-sigma factor family protein n=1 Tax=Streptomyces sp. NPDC051567 TaxID=3365660 RepID=UPI003797E1F5
MSPTPGTTGTIRHPDVSEISDLTEGLLPPSRTAEVSRHLGDCALCADVRTSLEEIRSLLGTLPGPPRMPADLVGRIDAALAAEALLDATSPRDRTTPPLRLRTEDHGVSRETSPFPLTGQAVRRPSGRPHGVGGPGRRRARRRIAVIAGTAGAAACALGIFLFSGFSGTPAHHATSRSNAASAAAQPPSDGAYTSQSLRSSVHRLLASGPGARKAAPEERSSTYGENTGPASGLAPEDARTSPVPSCVQAATGRSDTPLATERGSYQGTDVYLLVLPHTGDPTTVDAYLVDAHCGNSTPATPGKTLLTSSYPRS